MQRRGSKPNRSQRRAKLQTASAEAPRGNPSGRRRLTSPLKSIKQMADRVWAWLRRGGALFLLILALLAGVLDFSEWLPDVSITPRALRDDADPMSAIFVVANDGYLSMHDVRFSCVPLALHPGHTYNDLVIELRPEKLIRGRGGKHTVTCWGVFTYTEGQPYRSRGKVELRVNYRAGWWPFRIEDQFRYESAVDAKGNFEWTPVAE
jgi:hypothetical protein